jgi:hypothetical protein
MELFVYELVPQPDKLGDPRWSVSRYTGMCRVTASSEPQARAWAAGKFTVPMIDHWPDRSASAWLSDELVLMATVRRAGDGSAEGVIFVPLMPTSAWGALDG